MSAAFDNFFFYGLGLSIGVLGLWWAARSFTFWLEQKVPLTPNCLLTRKPLVLLSPPSPFWQFWSKEQQAVRYLRNHGYDSLLIPANELQSVGDLRRFHFIASSKIPAELFAQNERLHLSFVDFSSKPSLLNEAVRRAEADFI